MPSSQDRRSLRSEELPEAPMQFPNGGIQSEMPPTEYADIGFQESSDFMFYRGAAWSRFGFNYTFGSIPNLPIPEIIVGFWNFYDSNGALHQGVWTPTRMWVNNAGTWAQVLGGPALTGSIGQLFSWSALNYEVCFGQGSNTLLVWNGSGTYSTPASAPVAQYIAEIGNHLFVISPARPQRYQWSGINDPTDWTSLSSGFNDIVNDMGPINGILKLGQIGYGWHNNGIMQILPTGIGGNPFAFIPIANARIGITFPFSLARLNYQGQEFGMYVGRDNVYMFNGSSIIPIGDRPMADGRRVGARSRILADCISTQPGQVRGYVSYSGYGQPFVAYWLLMIGANAPYFAWVYNVDEGNWTHFSTSTIVPTDLGTYILPSDPTFETTLLGSQVGSFGMFQSQIANDQPAALTSGRLIFKDARHKKTVKKIRVRFIDQAAATFTLQLTNEAGVTQSFTFSTGTGSGDVLSWVQEFNLAGLRFQYVLSIPKQTQTAIVDISPMYDTGGEQRGGAVEN